MKSINKYDKMPKYQIFGGIAQLVERLNGIQEVAGSIPTISTTLKTHSFCCVFFVFIGVFCAKLLFLYIRICCYTPIFIILLLKFAPYFYLE